MNEPNSDTPNRLATELRRLAQELAAAESDLGVDEIALSAAKRILAGKSKAGDLLTVAEEISRLAAILNQGLD